MRACASPLTMSSIAAALVLAESGRRARTLRVGRHEERIFRRFNDAPDALHPPVWAMMQSGSLAAVFVVGGALARKARPAAVTAVIAGTTVWSAAKLIKPHVGRGRPSDLLDGVEVRGLAQSGLGYPSGHAAVALTLASVAAPAGGPVWRTAALAFAGTVGAARMYVGAHLPLDVAGGLAIGTLGGRTARWMLDEWS